MVLHDQAAKDPVPGWFSEDVDIWVFGLMLNANGQTYSSLSAVRLPSDSILALRHPTGASVGSLGFLDLRGESVSEGVEQAGFYQLAWVFSRDALFPASLVDDVREQIKIADHRASPNGSQPLVAEACNNGRRQVSHAVTRHFGSLERIDPDHLVKVSTL